MMKLYAKARDGLLYDAEALFDGEHVTVLKGSRINLVPSANFRPSSLVATKRADRSLVDNTGVLLKNIEFNSLSTAACFITGRTANGMITWKTSDGRYVRYTISGNK